MKKPLRLITLSMGLFSLQGCTLFTNPKEVPVIEDKVEHIGTLATTADRRLVIFDRQSSAYCAEPSPDTADNLASSLASALEGSDGEITVKAEMAKSFASTVRQLFIRTQGLQLYRDGMYSLCQDYVKGAVSLAEYKIKQDKLLETAERLIKLEIPELRYLRQDPVISPVPPTPATVGGAKDGTNSDTPGDTSTK